MPSLAFSPLSFSSTASSSTMLRKTCIRHTSAAGLCPSRIPEGARVHTSYPRRTPMTLRLPLSCTKRRLSRYWTWHVSTGVKANLRGRIASNALSSVPVARAPSCRDCATRAWAVELLATNGSQSRCGSSNALACRRAWEFSREVMSRGAPHSATLPADSQSSKGSLSALLPRVHIPRNPQPNLCPASVYNELLRRQAKTARYPHLRRRGRRFSTGAKQQRRRAKRP